jgi:dTDP-4-dehydrorhamnose 3,5-epimerase
MNILPLEIPGVLLLLPQAFGDERGYFLESYSTETFPGDVVFVQDNVSFSARGVLRGLHLQEPNAQGKLVMAIAGTIWDVAVDVRVGSPTFGKWVAAELSSDNKSQLYIPPGCAHGFCVTSETAHVYYKCTRLYSPSSEMSIHFSDPDLNIDWPIEQPLLSQKDNQAPRLAEIPVDRLPRYGK